MPRATIVFATRVGPLVLLLASVQQLAADEIRMQLIRDYRTIVAIEHDSRHLYHLQTKALVAHLGGWARPANEDGSEMDSFVGVSEQVIPINLNRIKARLARGGKDDVVAADMLEIIALFEDAIATGL